MDDSVSTFANHKYPGSQIHSRYLFDVDEQARSLSGWTQEYQQLSCGNYAGSVLSLDLPEMELLVESTNRQLHQRGQIPENSIVLAFALNANGDGRISGKKFDKNTMIVLTNEHELDFRTPDELIAAALVVDIRTLTQYFPAFDGTSPLDSAMQNCFAAIEPAILDRLRNYINAIFSELQLGQIDLSYPAARKVFYNELIGNFLQTLESLNSVDQTIPRSALMRLKTVNKAIEHMRSHMEEAISIIDVCAVLHVEQRVLNYCFQEVIGMSPISYLKYLRLNKVRRELLRVSSASCNIGNIAASSGFWHLSRFSNEYRKLFGELPSNTVRRSGLTM